MGNIKIRELQHNKNQIHVYFFAFCYGNCFDGSPEKAHLSKKLSFTVSHNYFL